MKRLIIAIAMILGLGALSSLAWVGISKAADVRSGDAPTVGKSETVEGSVYIAGRTVTVDGTIKGDVFCAGMNVYVTGTIEGDVICAGQVVRVTGKVLGDVRLAGQTVDLGADVGGSATVAAQSLNISGDTKIGRDLTAYGETARIDGQVGRDFVGGGDQVMIDGTVGRNAQLELNNLALESKAKIGGDLSYRATNQALINESATVGGATHYEPLPQNMRRYDNTVSFAIWSSVYGFCSLLLIGLAAIAIVPRWFDKVGEALRTRPLGSFGYGAVAFIGTPLVVILLMVTVVGIPLALIMLLLWIAALVASFAVTAYAVGWMAVEKMSWPARGRRITAMVLGLLILGLLGFIPVVGGIVRFTSLVFGLGAIAVALGQRVRPRANKVTKGAKA